MNEPDPKSVTVAAASLNDAIEAHAAAIADGASDDAVVRALNALRSAAIAYASHVFDASGWGDPFADLEHEEDDEDESEDVEGSGIMVAVDVHYEVRVADIDKTRALLPDDSQVEGEPLAVDLITELFLADGWDPAKYPRTAIETVRKEWSCALS